MRNSAVKLVLLGRNVVELGCVAGETSLGRKLAVGGTSCLAAQGFGRAAGSNLETKPHSGQSGCLTFSKTVHVWAKLPETSQADLEVPVGVRES